MKTQTVKQSMKLGLSAMALGICLSAFGQAPVIDSLSRNGLLICSDLKPGSVASVEWAPSVTGPWTNNWAGLDSVTVNSNGMIQVSVPMFYRVRGTGAPSGMVLIPAGSFTMGDTFDEGFSEERPTHSVYVSAFYMDKYEVTKGLWDEVYQWATNHGYSFDNTGSGKALNHPVQIVSWYDCVKWCNARSEKEGLAPAYYTESAQTNVYRTGQSVVQNDWVNWTNGYRLPTEAEWEKAARGGASGHQFPWSDVDTISHSQANYYAVSNSPAYDVSPTQGYHPDYANGGEPYTSPVGVFSPTGNGLYDMAGNVWEWCWDSFDYTWYGQPGATQDDTRGPSSSGTRVLRGGTWKYNAIRQRCARRDTGFVDEAQYSIGFRCVRGL